MARMTAGRAVVESLIAQGVDTVFGIISVHTLNIYDALREAVAAGRIRFIGARHEHALTCMADGYARVTGKPGVLLTSSGPGAADSVGGMGEAYHSSVPLLQITTEVEHEWINSRRGVTHEARDQLDMFASVTGWRANAGSAGEVPDLITDAFANLRTQHPRPALLSIPTDYLGIEDEFEIAPPAAHVPAKADTSAVAEAAALLAGAKRPLILVGAGAMGAATELRALAERIDALVAAADAGKGAFPDDHPLGLGTALGGRVWGENPVQAYAGTCDVALVVGTSLPWRSTDGVGLKLPGNLIQVDIDPGMFGRNFPVGVGLQGNAKAILQQLLDALPNGRGSGVGEAAAVAKLREEALASVAGQFPNEQRTWETVRSAIDRDAIVVCDSTVPAYVAQRCLPTYEPRTYHHPHGWVSIGFGFAASLGAKVGAPDRQVLCVTGDGGFQYNLQELASAKQYGIAPIVLIFNDNAWGVLKRYQHQRFDDRLFATDLSNPDFERLAGAYGVDYARAESAGALGDTLRKLGKPGTLTLVEVPIPDGFVNFT